MPFEIPENPAATRNAASMITSHPSGPPFVAPRNRPTTRMIIAWIVATTADCRTRANTIALRRAGVARNRSIDAAVEVLDRSHAGPGAGEEGGHDRDPRGQVVDVRRRPEARQFGDAPEELAVEQEPEHRLDQHQRDPDRLSQQVPHQPDEQEQRLGERAHVPARSSEWKSRPV